MNERFLRVTLGLIHEHKYSVFTAALLAERMTCEAARNMKQSRECDRLESLVVDIIIEAKEAAFPKIGGSDGV